VYSFRGGNDGMAPVADLVNVKGTLYGTATYGGGAGCGGDGCGVVFSVTPAGSEKVVYAFEGGSDGVSPGASLVDMSSTLYGTTTSGGGTGCGGNGCGTVFAVTQAGTETVLHSFAGGTDGSAPGRLTEVSGALYGNTSYGGGSGCGGSGCGTVFSLTPSGSENVLYAFEGGHDGSMPYEIVELNGALYGTTAYGGGTGCGGAGCGTVYYLTLDGSEKMVHVFKGDPDGALPGGGLIDVHGTLYGTTTSGGANDVGTLFSVGKNGGLKVVYSFEGMETGASPSGGLAESQGTFYGTTVMGGGTGCGRMGCGAVFSVTPK
jgi:uncharacterized repeat protein (TIGR03803 family)